MTLKSYSHLRSPLLEVKVAMMINDYTLLGSDWIQSEAKVAVKIIDLVEEPLLKKIKKIETANMLLIEQVEKCQSRIWEYRMTLENLLRN